MLSRDQSRAMLAHQHILDVKQWSEEARKKKYGSMVHRLPALIRSAGLSQALHFVFSRAKRSKDQSLILEHLAAQLKTIDASIKDSQGLLDTVRKAELGKYSALTREALACVDWYRRLVQGELGIEAADEGESHD